MITFSVFNEQYGWAIRVGEGMKTLFRSRDLAIREANCLADAIRRHGECAEVIVESAGPNEVPKRIKGSSSARLDALARGHLSDMSELRYFMNRAEECIGMARNAPKGKQSELLRLASEWLALGCQANGFIVKDHLEQPHKFN